MMSGGGGARRGAAEGGDGGGGGGGGGSSGGEASPSRPASRPIPIRSRGPFDGRGAGASAAADPGRGFAVASSAPAPRAPIIGSMPAPSILARHMPDLELPPQSRVAHNMAQSAPSAPLAASKPILHALRIRPRSGSNEAIPRRAEDLFDPRGAAPSSSSSGARSKRRGPRGGHRVSFDGDLDRSPILLEGNEDDEDEEQEGGGLGGGLPGAPGASSRAHFGSRPSDLIDTLDESAEGTKASQFEPSSMEVFSAIRSLTEDSSFAQRVAASAPPNRAMAVAEALGRSSAHDPQAAQAAAAEALGMAHGSSASGSPAIVDAAAMVGDLESLRLDSGASGRGESRAGSMPGVDDGADETSASYMPASMDMGVDVDGMEMDMDMDMDMDLNLGGGAHVGIEDDGPFEQFEMEGLSSEKQPTLDDDDDDDGNGGHDDEESGAAAGGSQLDTTHVSLSPRSHSSAQPGSSPSH